MAILKDVDKQLEIIKRGTVEIISEGSLRERIENSIQTKTPLTVKAGFDPSAPDIHLGHTVLLRKMRHFQDMGHRVIFLIGDHTAMIGDPSGAVKTRPQITRAEVKKNARTYKQQIAAVLNIRKLDVCFNSEWLDKMKSREIAHLVSKYSVSRMLERDDFSKRYKQQKPISMLEFFYPLLQGYDSVHLKADIELGGTDQKFNLLVGRDIQNAYGQKPQIVITMPLLEGTDGVQKMSKSYGNYIGIDEAAGDMFGKIMSISDEMMLKYYELLTDIELSSVTNLHPMEAKKNLAADIVRQYHGKWAAKRAQSHFEKTFQKRDPFSEMKAGEIKMDEATLAGGDCFYLLCSSQILALVSSKSELRRLISQNAVTVNGQRVSDIQYRLEYNREYRIKVGKTKFKKIVLKRP
jgi:tyrosyl-tRNA synthetase